MFCPLGVASIGGTQFFGSYRDASCWFCLPISRRLPRQTRPGAPMRYTAEFILRHRWAGSGQSKEPGQIAGIRLAPSSASRARWSFFMAHGQFQAERELQRLRFGRCADCRSRWMRQCLLADFFPTAQKTTMAAILRLLSGFMPGNKLNE